MQSILDRVVDLAITIQQIPAPTFAEGKRSKFLKSQFEEEGLADISIDELGNVYGRFPGTGSAPSILVSAHTDTVFSEGTDLRYLRKNGQIVGPGIGDNAVAVASLLGLIWALKDRNKRLAGDLWLVGNVGEEGLGDLIGMRAVVKRFKDQPLAYIILEGMALGHIYHRALGVRRYRVTFKTGGGHSWGDFGRPSAIHAMAQLITALTDQPLPDAPRTTMNVGMVKGGTSINTIAPSADFEIDLRSEDPEVLKDLISFVKRKVEEANQPDMHINMDMIGNRPSGELRRDHPLVKLGQACVEAQGISPQLSIGSTDANVPISKGIPAICIGLTTGGGAHTTSEFIDIQPLEQGIQQMVELVEKAYLVLTN